MGVRCAAVSRDLEAKLGGSSREPVMSPKLQLPHRCRRHAEHLVGRRAADSKRLQAPATRIGLTRSADGPWSLHPRMYNNMSVGRGSCKAAVAVSSFGAVTDSTARWSQPASTTPSQDKLLKLEPSAVERQGLSHGRCLQWQWAAPESIVVPGEEKFLSGMWSVCSAADALKLGASVSGICPWLARRLREWTPGNLEAQDGLRTRRRRPNVACRGCPMPRPSRLALVNCRWKNTMLLNRP